MTRSRRHKLFIAFFAAGMIILAGRSLAQPAAGSTAGAVVGGTADAPSAGATASGPLSGQTIAPCPANGTLGPGSHLPTPLADKGNTVYLPPMPARTPGVLKQNSSIKVTVSVDKAVIRVGDLIHYVMTIAAPAGSKLLMPPPGAQLGQFLIRDYKFPGLEEKDQTWSERLSAWLEKVTGTVSAKPQRFEFTITAYETGDLVIPPFPIAVMTPDGEQHELYAESARVRVAPVTSPEDLTIKDIRAPQRTPVPPKKYLPWLLVPLALLVGIAAGVWGLSRWRREEEVIVPERPAHELAFEELNALAGEGLLAAGEYEKFYTRLSWIIRKYLALRYSIYALEYTTTEIRERLLAVEIERGDYERARELLEEADEVKFARHTPALTRRNTALARAEELVERTRERPPAAMEEAA